MQADPYLLDTHALLWFLTGDRRLGGAARQAIVDGSTTCRVSLVSHWEICLKQSIGKLRLQDDWEPTIDRVLADNRIAWLPIERRHTRLLVDLPFHHHDPFDRLLICQALADGHQLISGDPVFRAYPELSICW